METRTITYAAIFFFGILYLSPRSLSCQHRHLLLSDPKQLFGVRMHYLNDPLCFSQSGCCRRLINLTCLLCCTQRGQTHIAYSKCALRHPPFFARPLFPLTAAIKTYTLCINHQIIIQIDEIVTYANEETMVVMIFLHNECCLFFNGHQVYHCLYLYHCCWT